MNRQEAALVIKDRLNDEIWKQENGLEVFPVNMDAFWVAIKALRGPVPDPDTGLVPCGCGGKAKVWPSDLRQAMVTDYEVGCTECATTTVWVRGKQENAMNVWNTAMGWKGGAE